MDAFQGCRRCTKNAAVVVLLLLVASTSGRRQVNGSTLTGTSGDDTNRIRPLAVNNLLTAASAVAQVDESIPECSAAFQRIQDQERFAYAPYPPDFKGTWVSQECETRPGPEFLLRHYHFERDGSFKLLQHFYGDEWCTTPVYTLTARGQLHIREPSWIVPGGSDAEYNLQKVTVMAYSEDVMDEVVQRVNRTCPGFAMRPWRVRKDYVIYSYTDDKERERELIKRHSGNGHGKRLTNDLRPKRVSHNGSHHHGESNQQRDNDDDDPVTNETLEEKDCLHAFHAVYHELQLMRSVRRSVHVDLADLIKLPSLDQKKKLVKLTAQGGEPSVQTYLYLGDIHPQLELRASYRPTAYQPPLVRHHEIGDCHVCRAVAKSSEKSPPHLHARPRLPVYPVGDWISSACETRPIGTYLVRRIKFVDIRSGFLGFYTRPTFQALFHYFSDAACANPTLSVLVGGHYASGADSGFVQGATEFDFYIQTVSITVHEESTARNLNGLKGNKCALDGSWRVGQPQDVTPTGGCSGLGISVPSVANDLLKMDLDGVGESLLYFGEAVNQQSADPKAAHPRPTAYLPPLRQCRSPGGDLGDDASNDLPLIPHARTAETHGNGHVTPSSANQRVSSSLLTGVAAVAIYWWKF